MAKLLQDFSDSWSKVATPDNKRRPRGSMGAEIFVDLDGSPPAD